VECPVCEAENWSERYVVNGHRYVSCVACGLTRLDPIPRSEEAARLYDDSYFEAGTSGGYLGYARDEALHRRNARGRLRKLASRPQHDAVMVDVGCAHGFTMVEAAAAGWTAVGVDVNETARKAVQAHGMRAEPSLEALEDLAPTVSAVTFFQSLEHLVDPLGALRWAAEHLDSEGTVLIETWNRSSWLARLLQDRWQQVSPPSVLWLFGRDDLQRLCERAGLSIVSYRASAKWVSVGLVAGQMAGRGSRFGRALLRSPFRRLAVPYALGDLVTVKARPAAAHRTATDRCSMVVRMPGLPVRVSRAICQELAPLHLTSRIFARLIALIPDLALSRTRTTLLRLSGWNIGPNSLLYGVPRLSSHRRSFSPLTIGDHTLINVGCFFELTEPISIGDGVALGHEVMLLTSTHRLGTHERRAGELQTGSIRIDDGAWIGSRSVILPGVTIGSGAVVAAGSVVTKDVDANSVASGAPASTTVRRLPG
jgi:maltose O-acetyltransferase